MQDILRDAVADLARKVEFRIEDDRPTLEFWERRNKE
jgi:hypothetical protein